MSNLQLRVVSALVLAAVVLTVTWLGGMPFKLLMAAMAVAIMYEWMTMSSARTTTVDRLLAWGGLVLCLALVLLGYPAAVSIGALVLSATVAAAYAAFSAGGQWASSGLAYAGLSAIAMSYLRGVDWPGFAAIIFLFAVVWATDILAYFVGRAVGGPKLAPSISPGKTQSGAFGGAAGGVISSIAVVRALGAGSVAWLAIVALLLSVVSQAGDLFESWVKRRNGVKDSSYLIPGHGGVMDRVDGLVAAAMALYLIGAAFGGLDTPADGLFGP